MAANRSMHAHFRIAGKILTLLLFFMPATALLANNPAIPAGYIRLRLR
jgi:hypothetical protein